MSVFLITFMIALIIGSFGGLLYIIYIPIRNLLIKKGKLSPKLNKQINFSYFSFLILLVAFLYFNKDYRTPSKKRLQEYSEVKLPSKFKVHRDEFQDMWQDFHLYYDIELTEISTVEVVKSIKESRFYNPNVSIINQYSDSAFVKDGKVRSVWYKSKEGYSFIRHSGGGHGVSIKLDTATNFLKYEESQI